MKKLIFVILVLLASCSIVVFDKPQPTDGNILYEFPDEFHGTYFNEDFDTLVIKDNSLISYSFIDKSDSTEMPLISKMEGMKTLGHSFLIKKDNSYFYNELVLDSFWLVSKIELQNDSLRFYFTDINEESVKIIFDNFEADSLRGEQKSAILIKTKNNDFQKFYKLKLFNEKIEFMKIK